MVSHFRSTTIAQEDTLSSVGVFKVVRAEELSLNHLSSSVAGEDPYWEPTRLMYAEIYPTPLGNFVIRAIVAFAMYLLLLMVALSYFVGASESGPRVVILN